MNLFRSAKLLAILASLSLSYPLKADDSKGAVCSADPSSTLAFVATLTDLTGIGAPPQWSLGTFRVTELLQGEGYSEVKTLVRNDVCDDSRTAPAIGKSYLVVTHILPKGSSWPVYQLEHCEQIRPVEQATAAIGYLRNSKGGNTPAEVSGEARVETHGYPWKKVPSPITKVHLAGANQQLDFVSDEDGQFHGALSPGKYAMTAEFPAGYELEYGTSSTITVTAHRCTQVTVSARPTASITAHLVDVDGIPLGPMSNVQLTLETAGDQEFVQSVWPDENSNLKADGLMPGQYILGLNTYLPVNRGSAPYPPTYFPGVGARSEAQVITLGAGEQKVLTEMQIKKGLRCEIPVLVIDSLGKPASSATVALAYPDYPHFYIEPREQTDENGRQMVYAIFPGHVLLRAEKKRGDGATLMSENLDVRSCPAESVSLKLSRVALDQHEPKKN